MPALAATSATSATSVTAAPAARVAEPQRCDIVTVITATMSHRDGSCAARRPGSAVPMCTAMPA